jgi:dTDP-4-amino-4,6-dideoxygalactose transaminase
MINWVSKKTLDIEKINSKILECIETKHFTNNGKNVIETQENIKELFKINSDKHVLLTCNGAMGLNAIIGGLNIYFNKKLKWIVQSFTFPCSTQGNLVDSIIVDIDDNMGPNINELHNKIDEYDGIIITNCFGTTTNIQLYEDFCKKYNKLLIFDNAASSFSYYKNKNILNFGDACMVSLHHTKPIGFGEGGFIVFNKNLLEVMEKSICFGYTKTDRYTYSLYGNNYKMSEISCLYISEYLKNVNKIFTHHTNIISYFISKYNENNLHNKVKLFKNFSNYDECLLATIPLIFNKPVNINVFIENNIEAKKYYFPLGNNHEKSITLFNNIICLPLNLDIDYKIIDKYIDIINTFE